MSWGAFDPPWLRRERDAANQLSFCPAPARPAQNPCAGLPRQLTSLTAVGHTLLRSRPGDRQLRPRRQPSMPRRSVAVSQGRVQFCAHQPARTSRYSNRAAGQSRRLNMTSYDDAFFRYVNSSATRSARHLLPMLLSEIPAHSILDVGCGQGAWLAVWQELGIREVVGIDGAYVDVNNLLIPRDRFISHDLRESFQLNRRFSIVQSLEVAEHLPESCAADFVESLILHGDLVLFSAATKGQGGDGHVNEQSYEFWRAIFARHGYFAVDFLRPQLIRATEVAPWYRFNTLLYASEAVFPLLPEPLRAARVPTYEPIRDLSPIPYRIRKLATRLLPVALSTLIAKIKERATTAVAANGSRQRP